MQWYDVALSASVAAGLAVALSWPGPTPATEQEPTSPRTPLPEVFAPDLSILFPGAPVASIAPGTPNRTESATPPESGSPAPTRTTRPQTPTTIAAAPPVQGPTTIPPPPPPPQDDNLIDVQLLIELGIL